RWIDPGTAQVGVADDLEVLHSRVSLEGLEIVELEHVGASRRNAKNLSGLPLLILGGGTGGECRPSCNADKDGQPRPANGDHASSPKYLLRIRAMLFIFIAAMSEVKLPAKGLVPPCDPARVAAR